MAFAFGTNFLLFLWFSGVNHFVNPSSEAGTTFTFLVYKTVGLIIRTKNYCTHYGNIVFDYLGSGLDGMEPDYQQPADMLQMEDQRLYFQYQNRFAMPPSHIDPIDEPLRRQYRFFISC